MYIICTTGQRSLSADTMAVAMMEAVADFSKKNLPSNIGLVRVVIFQAEMVSAYVEQMKQAAFSGGGSVLNIPAVFKAIGNTVKGTQLPGI